MDHSRFQAISEKYLLAWNSQDVESVVACYTDDLIYSDPNTHGKINGKDAMRHYLRKLFTAWQMNWSLREPFLFADQDGGAFLWHVTFRKIGTDRTIEVDGMDLILLRGDLVERNEVYFDRGTLTSLL